MNKILILFFAILLTPFLGLPAMYDRWIVSVLCLVILFFAYQLFKNRNKVTPTTPKDHANKTDTVEKKSTKKKRQKKAALISDKEKDEIKEAVEKSNKA